MPIQAPQWTEFLSCPVCCNDFDVTHRGPISLGCGHTICHTCLANLHPMQCPFDQSPINTEIEKLPVNEALLQLVGDSVPNNNTSTTCQPLFPEDSNHYQAAKRCIEELALYLKPCQASINNASGVGFVSRPMQRKLVTLVGCQLMVPEGRARAVRAARSLGERSVTELILQHQNPQQLSANLWAAVRARGCQFLGPGMQEEVLKLVLLALEDGSALSRKVLVMFVVQRLEPHFPQASKTSIGHVVQLLYRASCFKVSKREGDSSLMQLKEEFRTYEALRREHDAQIVQIATEAGLRIAPDQWSALLYGDTCHKSHMQSIIDKLQTPQSFAQSAQELVIALQRTSDPGQLSNLRQHLELLAAIDPNPESEPPLWSEVRASLEAIKIVVKSLVEFILQHGNRKSQDGSHCTSQSKYKVSMCRDLTQRGSCPRATSCTFAHSDVELDKYRSKNRKTASRSNTSLDGCTDSKSDKSLALSGNTKNFKLNKEIINNFCKNHDTSYRENFCQVNKSSLVQNTGVRNENYIGSINNHIISGNQCTQNILPKDLQCPPCTLSSNPEDYSSNVWDTSQSIPNLQNIPNNSKKHRTAAKTLAMLWQRKMEIISQLENFVSKQSSLQMNPNYYDNESQQQSYSIWTHAPSIQPTHTGCINFANNTICCDNSHYDDEFIPFEGLSANKYGPISRKTLLRSTNGIQQQSSMFCEGMPSPVSSLYTVPASGPLTSRLYNQCTDGGLQLTAGTSLCESSYINLCQENTNVGSHQDTVSKDLIIESQKVRHELKLLEKKINELKIATQGAAQNEGERLAQELQMIEAGIREKEKDVCDWSPYSSLSWTLPSQCILACQNKDKGTRVHEDDTYEADIADDMREFEQRWETELQEHVNRWSTDEDSKKC